jgi:hypothetical protein
MTNLVFYPELFLEKVLSSSFFDDKILNDETELKSETIKILKKVRLNKDEQEGIRKILKNYKKREKENKGINDEKLLKDRIEDYVKYNEVENLKEKYKDKYYIWLPSSALVPDPQHQLLYGKKFKVGTGDKEGNMPGERWGCMCGMKILDVDENTYGMKEDKSRETKSIDNVIDGEVVKKYDDTGIIEGKVLKSITGDSGVDNRIIESNIVGSDENKNEMKKSKTFFSEFLGQEYVGFKGQEAINKLLEEKQGYVPNAFYRENIGYIALIWGDEKLGLNHIIKRRMDEDLDIQDFLLDLVDIIENGEIEIGGRGDILIRKNNKRIVISTTRNKFKIKFLLTAFVEYK